MTSDPIIQRVRGANPASATPIENAALLEAIVATPPDARLTQHAKTRRRRSRPTWIVAFGAVLCIGGATAWATGASSPLSIFQSASKYYDNVPRWHQDVILASLHKAATATIPDVGEVEMWFADSRQGGLCTALRLPDGQWAGAGREGAPLSPLDAGSTMPYCRPTRSQVNGTSPIFIIDGFDYEEADVNAPGPGRDTWSVKYGVVEGARTPVRVVDLVSGRSAPVEEGRFFALAVYNPAPRGRLIEDRLVALDAHGRRVAGRSEGAEYWRRLYRERQDRHRAPSGPEPATSRR